MNNSFVEMLIKIYISLERLLEFRWKFTGDTNAMFSVEKPKKEQPKRLMNTTFGFS
jgi:hypothetical protein